jgi:hypothetical protein
MQGNGSRVLLAHGSYRLETTPSGGSLVIVRQDDGVRRTVCFVEREEQWTRFVAAIESGAGEVAAVHAIDPPAPLEVAVRAVEETLGLPEGTVATDGREFISLTIDQVNALLARAPATEAKGM